MTMQVLREVDDYLPTREEPCNITYVALAVLLSWLLLCKCWNEHSTLGSRI